MLLPRGPSEPTSITNRASLKCSAMAQPTSAISPPSAAACKSLDRVLHGGGKLDVGAAELLEQHVAELWEGIIAPFCVSRATRLTRITIPRLGGGGGENWDKIAQKLHTIGPI